GLDGSVLNKWFHGVGGGKSGDLDLTGLARLLDCIRGSRKTDGSDGANTLEIWIGLHQILRDLKRLGGLIVRSLDSNQVQARILGQALLHVFDPVILIRGRDETGDDRDIAFLIAADVLGDGIDHGIANRLSGSLIDEEIARAWRAVGVPGDDL